MRMQAREDFCIDGQASPLRSGMAVECVPLTYAEWKRFTSHIAIEQDGCWRWKGLAGDYRYPRFVWRKRLSLSTRLMYAQVNGPLPAGLMVCHTCDHPYCVNPAHLFLGTNRENQLDASRKGRFPMQRPECQEAARKVKREHIPAILAAMKRGASGRELSVAMGLGANTVNRTLRQHGHTATGTKNKRPVSKDVLIQFLADVSRVAPLTQPAAESNVNGPSRTLAAAGLLEAIQ